MGSNSSVASLPYMCLGHQQESQGEGGIALAYSVFEDNLHAPRVFWQKFRHIICFSMNYHPAVLLAAVLGNLGASQSHLGNADTMTISLKITRPW